MNKIIASVGLVALGAANVQAQTPLTGPTTKWWNVQASVRGFYDDNPNTAPSHQRAALLDPTVIRIPKGGTSGFEINPKVGVTFGNDQTTFSADYQYSFLYYDRKPFGNTEHFDQDHTFNAALSHAFSERYSIRAREAFVIGQEPDALRYDAAFHTPFRVSGNNIVNYGGLLFNAELTPEMGLEAGYDYAWFDYRDKLNANPGKNVDGVGNVLSPSRSGLLDRIEQYPHIALTWKEMRDTTLSLGYRFGQINYTGDEVIQGNINDKPDSVVSSDRDVRSHTVYLGVDHQFRPDFYGSAQAGVSYYDYYNLDTTSWGPYARLSLTYVYMPESTLQVGFQEGRSATDIFGGGTTKADITRDSEASVVFAKVQHRIVPHLFANLNGSFQHSEFHGGTADNQTEDFYEFGANLEYQFNPFISVHGGYDFDHLDSDLGDRSYTRNKFYIGATASY
jgi:hypothetical protein